MKNFLIHGCFDPQTLQILIEKGVHRFSFDLRAQSLNLITLKDLKACLKLLSTQEVFLTFENESFPVIHSLLNLLEKDYSTFKLIFRGRKFDNKSLASPVPFYWVYDPFENWNDILSSGQCKGVLLPLQWQESYQMNPQFWQLLDFYSHEVMIHHQSFDECIELNLSPQTSICVDLSREVTKSYRMIDQQKIINSILWKRFHEYPSV
jgi:hypothetical protein